MPICVALFCFEERAVWRPANWFSKDCDSFSVVEEDLDPQTLRWTPNWGLQKSMRTGIAPADEG